MFDILKSLVDGDLAAATTISDLENILKDVGEKTFKQMANRGSFKIEKSEYEKYKENEQKIAEVVRLNNPSSDGYTYLMQYAETALSYLTTQTLDPATQEDVIGAMDFLKNNGADVNTPNKAGMTPLHLAALSGNQQIVIYLLGVGADKSAMNEKQLMPAHLARKAGHSFIEFLIEGHISVTRTADKNNSMIFSSCSGMKQEFLMSSSELDSSIISRFRVREFDGKYEFYFTVNSSLKCNKLKDKDYITAIAIVIGTISPDTSNTYTFSNQKVFTEFIVRFFNLTLSVSHQWNKVSIDGLVARLDGSIPLSQEVLKTKGVGGETSPPEQPPQNGDCCIC